MCINVFTKTNVVERGCKKSEHKKAWFMVFNVTFNNISVISWISVLLVEEIGIPEERLQTEGYNFFYKKVSYPLGDM
jgi:hypothetical protein